MTVKKLSLRLFLDFYPSNGAELDMFYATNHSWLLACRFWPLVCTFCSEETAVCRQTHSLDDLFIPRQTLGYAMQCNNAMSVA